MKQNKKIAIILSGCGFEDGAEIHESVLTMLALDKSGVTYSCFAPDIPQKMVIDHYNRKKIDNEQRNVLIESARIARGEIMPLKDFNAANFDAIVLPGGFGVASSFCSFAADGINCEVDDGIENAIISMKKSNKPIGALCISPVLIAKVIDNAKITIGNNADIAKEIAKTGATHENTGIGQIVVDNKNKIVTTPCYMLNSRISEVFSAIEKLVSALIKMA